jgi:hypothetical protein
LYVGGNFDTVAGVPALDIARYDGTWHAIGTGIQGVSVSGIAAYGGRLYASGLFFEAGGQPVTNIAA